MQHKTEYFSSPYQHSLSFLTLPCTALPCPTPLYPSLCTLLFPSLAYPLSGEITSRSVTQDSSMIEILALGADRDPGSNTDSDPGHGPRPLIPGEIWRPLHSTSGRCELWCAVGCAVLCGVWCGVSQVLSLTVIGGTAVEHSRAHRVVVVFWFACSYSMKWYYNSRTFDSRPTGHTSHHITSQQLCDVCCALCIIPSDARLIGSNSNISSKLCGCPPSYSSHSSPLLSSSSTLRSVRRFVSYVRISDISSVLLSLEDAAGRYEDEACYAMLCQWTACVYCLLYLTS